VSCLHEHDRASEETKGIPFTRRRSFALLVFLFFAGLAFLAAADTNDGFVRLLINERDGSFSLYYLTDQASMRYEPLLYPRDSSTSFLSVSVDGRVHQLGKSSAFRTSIERIDGNPAVIYESSFLVVRMVFTPVRTISSPNANGIKAAISIENKRDRDLAVGLRILLDTHLGEGRGGIPFFTDNLTISREMVVLPSSGENYWVSRGPNISLMGNIANVFNGSSKTPDFLHFANWKKLNDVPWDAARREGSAFNSIPYSIGDSAVCYYWEPAILYSGRFFNYTVYLTTEDTAWYELPHAAVVQAPIVEAPTISIAAIQEAAMREAMESNVDVRMLTLEKLWELVDLFIAGEIFLNEQDLLEIERALEIQSSQ